MKRLIHIILLLLPISTSAQLVAEYNFIAVTTAPGDGDYGMNGFFLDSDGRGFTVADVKVDTTFFFDGAGRKFVIKSKSGSSPFALGVDAVGHANSPVTGIGQLSDLTENGLPFYSGGVSAKVAANVNNMAVSKIDSLISSSGVSDSTRVIQDSILIYYQSGSEIGRDTIRTPGGSGSGAVSSVNGNTGAVTLTAQDIDSLFLFRDTSTATLINFKSQKVYGSEWAPLSGDFTFDMNDGIVGATQWIYHQSNTPPNINPMNFEPVGFYWPGRVNVIKAEFLGPTSYRLIFNEGTPPFRDTLIRTDCVIIMGQSNAGRFANQDGVTDDSIKGRDSLSVLLKALWSHDTVPSFAVYRGATFLYETAGQIDWNANSTSELADSALWRINGMAGSFEAPIYSSDQVSIGHYKRRNYLLNPRIIIWLQGEQDSGNTSARAAYEANLIALKAEINTRLGQPNLPWIAVELGAAYPQAGKVDINAAFNSIATSDTYFDVVDTSDFNGTYYETSSNIHYNSKGVQELAQRIYNIINTNGW